VRNGIDPTPARFQNMNDAAYAPVIVNAGLAARGGRKKRRTRF
jgi:hypothetical protein